MFQTQEDRDAAVVKDIILQLRSGKCGSIAGFLAAAEIDGSPIMLVGVSESEVREALVIEAVVRCFDHESLTVKRKVLRELLQVTSLLGVLGKLNNHLFVQKFWTPLPLSESFSPMVSTIRSRVVITFAHAACLFCASVKVEHLDMKIILNVLNSRIIPEMTCLTGKRAADARASVSRLLIELLRIESVTHELFGAVCSLTGQLLEMSDWKMSVEKTIRQLVGVTSSYWLKEDSLLFLPLRISEGEWPTIIRILSALCHLPDELRDKLLTLSIPCLHEVDFFDFLIMV